MKTELKWNQKMQFTGSIEGSQVSLDSKPPLGSGQGFTPKELVAIGLSGCTAMDVIALLKKYKEPVETLEVDTEVEASDSGHPIVFKSILLKFKATGQIVPEKLIEAITLSQTQYCGVSAMLSKSVPINYEVSLNGNKVTEGLAHFK